MKKLTFKYLLEFVVIVLGISVSFWFDKYQNRIENAKKERVVFSDLNTELRIISSMIENRRAAFLFDIQIINSLLQNPAKDSINIIMTIYSQQLRIGEGLHRVKKSILP